VPRIALPRQTTWKVNHPVNEAPCILDGLLMTDAGQKIRE